MNKVLDFCYKNIYSMLIASGVLILIVAQSVFIVNEKQIAMILQFGEVKNVIQSPGIHVKVPLIQNILRFDARILHFDANTNEVIVADQHRMLVDAFTKYKIIDPIKVYQTSRNEQGVESRLESIVDSTIRQVLGIVTMQDLLTEKRNEVMSKIQSVANHQATNFGIEIVDVRIKRTDLPKENSQAIYKRMQTEREKEAKEYRAQGQGEYAKIVANADRLRDETIANAKKKSEIIKGEADARVIAIFANSYGVDKDFFNFYRTMQSHQNYTQNKKIIMNFDNDYFKYIEHQTPYR